MDSVKIHMASTLAGFILDACFGDPHFLPHPVRGIGNLISLSEKGIRRLFPKTEKGELAGGALFVLLVLGITAALSFGLWGCGGREHGVVSGGISYGLFSFGGPFPEG